MKKLRVTEGGRMERIGETNYVEQIMKALAEYDRKRRSKAIKRGIAAAKTRKANQTKK